ncbi:unnamed protein product, partial [Tetraodon nigroviridis]
LNATMFTSAEVTWDGGPTEHRRLLQPGRARLPPIRNQKGLRTDTLITAEHRALCTAMREHAAARSRGGTCTPCCQVCVFAFTAFLLVAERTALIYCFVYYLWVGHNYCYAYLAGFTALFLLPGWGPQWLSYLWYLSDGRIRRRSLTWTHLLHLGLFKRLWECTCQAEEDVYGYIMQQADVSALRLLEALVVTLPETLLHTYVLICTDIGIKSPGEPENHVTTACDHGELESPMARVRPSPCSLGVFRRVSAVPGLGPGPLRPSLLPHPPGAPADDPGRRPLPSPLEGGPASPRRGAGRQRAPQQPFCRSSPLCAGRSACWGPGSPSSCSSRASSSSGCWAWSVGGPSARRKPALARAPPEGAGLFVAGVHWLGATFWMVSQQSDIIRSTSRWRLFNLVLGAIHIFFFLNVKYERQILLICGVVCEGARQVPPLRPSGLLLLLLQVMFVENAFLLLASSWLFSMVSWDTVGIPAAVLCSFLIGERAPAWISGKLWAGGDVSQTSRPALPSLPPSLPPSLSSSAGVISLVLYYRFLHPKSFEIFQSIRRRGLGGACTERGSTLSLEEKVTPTFHRQATLSGGGTLMDLPLQWEGWKHHHWLLIRLALKTGAVTRIWSAYGEGGLAGLMGLSEEFHSPDDFRVPQVREVAPAVRPAPSTVIARPVRKAPPTAILEIRRVPEIVPVQEAIPEESGEEMSSPPPSEDR